MSASPSDFAETEPTLTEDEAFLGAARCLDCGVCSECHACVDACPADAINLDHREREFETEVGTVVLATGFRLFPADVKPQYGYGRYKNVITGMQMDACWPHAPVQHGAAPERRQGARQHRLRDVHRLARQDGRQPALLEDLLHVLDQAEPADHGRPALADVTVYYIDMRSVGKGYDEFYEQAKTWAPTS